MVGTYKGLLLFCKCRWGGDSTWRCWGHLNTACCNWTCLNFFALRSGGDSKIYFSSALTPLYHPAPCIIVQLFPSCPYTLMRRQNSSRVQEWEGAWEGRHKGGRVQGRRVQGWGEVQGREGTSTGGQDLTRVARVQGRESRRAQRWEVTRAFHSNLIKVAFSPSIKLKIRQLTQSCEIAEEPLYLDKFYMHLRCLYFRIQNFRQTREWIPIFLSTRLHRVTSPEAGDSDCPTQYRRIHMQWAGKWRTIRNLRVLPNLQGYF